MSNVYHIEFISKFLINKEEENADYSTTFQPCVHKIDQGCTNPRRQLAQAIKFLYGGAVIMWVLGMELATCHLFGKFLDDSRNFVKVLHPCNIPIHTLYIRLYS